jgi:phosphate transporter
MNPSPSWPEWFLIAIPMCIMIDICIWLMLLWIYQPSEEETTPAEMFSNQHISQSKLSSLQIFVIAVTLVTIFLWCIQHTIEEYVGDMGVIGILPIIFFFGSGVLTKDDWNSMLWSGTLFLFTF